MTTSSTKAETIRENNQFAYTYAICSILLANNLQNLESDKARNVKMDRVITKKLNQFKSLFPAQSEKMRTFTEMIKVCKSTDLGDRKLKLLVDLSCSAPFFPYQLKYDVVKFNEAYTEIGKLLKVEHSMIEKILDARKTALTLHEPKKITKNLMIGLGGAMIFGLGGWMIGPALGGMLGAAAGFSGAAATSFGLALLGGGSLAAGGMGMAGGMWLITGTSAAIGMVGTTATSMLSEMTTTTVIMELVKLQISFVATDAGKNSKEYDRYILGLENQKSVLKGQLKDESRLNDEDSENLKALKAKIDAFDRTINWMKLNT